MPYRTTPTVEKIDLKPKNFVEWLSFELGTIKWYLINWYRSKRKPKYTVIKTLYIAHIRVEEGYE